MAYDTDAPRAPGPFPAVDRVPLGPFTFDVAVAGPVDGDVVLALHGFPESYDEWRATAGILAEAGYRVLAPDQRGYSPDARPAEVSAYSIEHLTADALGILDAYGVTAAHVLGHDWGAAVAWSLAAHDPDRVATLTAVSIPHPAALSRALAEDPEQQEKSAYIRTFRDPGRAEDALLRDGGRRFRDLFGDEDARDVPEQLILEHWRRLGDAEGLTAALNWYRAMDQRMAATPPVRVPTTYLWGTEDVALGRKAAEACAEHVTGPFRFVPVDGSGHWLPEQAPDLVAHEARARADPH